VPENPTSGSRFSVKGPKTEGSEGKADVLTVKEIRRLSLFWGLRSRAPESVEVKREPQEGQKAPSFFLSRGMEQWGQARIFQIRGESFCSGNGFPFQCQESSSFMASKSA
jgi:hypothetical protein